MRRSNLGSEFTSRRGFTTTDADSHIDKSYLSPLFNQVYLVLVDFLSTQERMISVPENRTVIFQIS